MLGVIGGSGLYQMEAIRNPRWVPVASPFGTPSDDLLHGDIGGVPVIFLPRHGRGHVHSPSTINYRANIDALKRAGVTDLVSLSACGSFREDLPPGSFVLIDQFIDWTKGRERTFFDEGLVAHVSLAHPTCRGLGQVLLAAARTAGLELRDGGTYLTIEGPQFSTKAESRMFRQWGADVIGMTNMPEARLAREAELRYATVAMVTDFDCWHEDEAAVQVANLLAILDRNVRKAQGLITALAALYGAAGADCAPCPSPCDRALDHAVITSSRSADPALLKRLEAVAGRIL
jgi:5'-methylthioadenosine phosphorylase